MKQKSIIVTGGAGFIGAHTVKILVSHGFLPIVLDDLSQGHKDFTKWGPFFDTKISNKVIVQEIINTYQPLAVLHFAGSTHVHESVINPAKYYHNNYVEVLSFLEVLLENNIKNFIFSSSCATYGEPKELTLNENHAQNPINPYGQSKLMLETTLLDYEKAYDFKSCFLRYFNAAGADPAADIGEDHDPETHLIPLVLDVALGKRETITICGTDYPTRDGTCVRDYIHVLDLAEAHVKALNYLLEGGKTAAFNLGSENGFTVKEIIEAIEKVTKKNIPAIDGPRREGDPPQLLADSSKAKKILNWQTRYSDIETIITDAWRWHQKRFT
ncbi:MAG: UDP-glucose 4-epimerase GalE [Candidatus Margulisiibacteriota bacterium]|jgi:UDP-glucose 4-epimerase